MKKSRVFRDGRRALVMMVVTVAVQVACTPQPPAPTPTSEDTALVRVRLVNDSETRHVVPNLGICPNGMANQPHHFVNPSPALAPMSETMLTSVEIAGDDGDCLVFATDFMVGLCGWSFGSVEDDSDSVATRFGGQIGIQFSCGDTIVLHWSDTGEGAGTWTSEVEPAAGNDPPQAPFGVL